MTNLDFAVFGKTEAIFKVIVGTVLGISIIVVTINKKLREKIDSTRLKEMFETFDVNKDHQIDREEFKKGLNEKLRSSIKHKRETDIVGGDTF